MHIRYVTTFAGAGAEAAYRMDQQLRTSIERSTSTWRGAATTAEASGKAQADALTKVALTARETAAQNVAAKLKEKTAAQELALEYGKLAKLAQKNSQEQITAYKLQADAAAKAGVRIREAGRIGASGWVGGGHAERTAGRDVRGLASGTGALGSRALAFGSTAFLGGAIAGAGIKGVLDATKAMQVEESLLRNTLKNANISWRDNQAAINDTLRRTSEYTGFLRTDLTRSFTTLVRTTGSVTQATKDLSVAADVSRARHIGLDQATKLVMLAQQGHIGLLRRQGITLTAVTTQEDLLANAHAHVSTQVRAAAKAWDLNATGMKAVDTLAAKFSGSAKAYGMTAAGAAERYRAAVEELQLQLGRVLLPVLANVVGALTDWVRKITANGSAMKTLNSIMGIAKTVFGAVHDTIKAADTVTGGFSHTLEVLLAIVAINKVRAIGGGITRYLIEQGILRIGPAAVIAEGEVAVASAGMVVSVTAVKAAVLSLIGSTGIGLIVIAVGIATMEIINHWSTVKRWFTDFADWITQKFKAVVGFVGSLLAKIPSWLPGMGQFHDFGVAMVNWAKSTGTSTGTAMAQAFSNAVTPGMQQTVAALTGNTTGTGGLLPPGGGGKYGARSIGAGGVPLARGATGSVTLGVADLEQALARYGAHVNDDYARTGHATNSYHYRGEAIDLKPSAAVAQQLYARRNMLAELFIPTTLPGGGLYHYGKAFTDPALQAEHQDHIHVAYTGAAAAINAAFGTVGSSTTGGGDTQRRHHGADNTPAVVAAAAAAAKAKAAAKAAAKALKAANAAARKYIEGLNKTAGDIMRVADSAYQLHHDIPALQAATRVAVGDYRQAGSYAQAHGMGGVATDERARATTLANRVAALVAARVKALHAAAIKAATATINGQLRDINSQQVAALAAPGDLAGALKAAGIDSTSAFALQQQGATASASATQLNQVRQLLQRQLVAAQQARIPTLVNNIKTRLDTVMQAITDATLQAADYAQQAAQQAIADALTSAQHNATMAGGGLSMLQIQHQLADINNTDAFGQPNAGYTAAQLTAQANYITGTQIGAQQGVLAQLRSQLANAQAGHDVTTYTPGVGSSDDAFGRAVNRRTSTTTTQHVVDQNLVNSILEQIQQVQQDIGAANLQAAQLIQQAAQASKQAAEDAAQVIVQHAGHVTNMQNLGYQNLQLQERLAGTFDTLGSATERSAYIKTNILPALQGELQALQGQLGVATAQGDRSLADQIAEAIAGKQNDILQAQLDAQEQTAAATQSLADSATQGSLGFGAGGENWTDLLMGAGVGA